MSLAAALDAFFARHPGLFRSAAAELRAARILRAPLS